MGRESRTRVANGVVSAVLVVFFLAHGALGAVYVSVGFSGPAAGLVWLGVLLVAMHVVLSVFASRDQLTDAERPPSARKKRHLALKWATSAALAVVAAAHVALPLSSSASAAVIVLVSAALAAHACVGARSLLKDIGVDRRYKAAFRVAVCAILALCAVVAGAAALP